MKKLKLALYILIPFAICAFVYFKYFNAPKQQSSEASGIGRLAGQFEGVVAKASNFVQDIEVSGTILPFDETTLTSEVSGKVVSLNLQEGKPVKKGSLLVKIFDEDLQAQLKMLEVQLKIAKNNEQRMKTLLGVQGTSQQEYDATLLQVNNISSQIDIIKVNIGKTEIKAPYDGVIGLRKISIGQYISPSVQIATIRAINSLKLDFSVPETYASSIKPGSKIEFSVSGSEAVYNANVMANEMSIESDSRNLNVRALVSGNIKGLVPGAFAKVKANLGSKDKAIMIPTSAIIPQASEKRVYLVKNGIAQLTTIQTGLRRTSDIEALSGISLGDTIVVTGLMFIKPNTPIKFSKVN